MKPLLAAAFIAVLTGGSLTAPAFAHSAMIVANIADKASLPAAPPQFIATFEHEATVATVKLVSNTGQVVALNYKAPAVSSKTFSVALPKLAAGSYTLSWRAIAKDGHAMPGSVHFTVTGN